jgi:PPOX class probable F420-dependent enzyme
MHTMTPDECRQFLQEGKRTMIVATLRADGPPHLAPVWYTLDGDRVVFETSGASAKVQHIRHNPAVSLCVDDEVLPLAYVTIEGTAVIADDPSEVRHWTGRIGARYLGEDKAEAYARRVAGPGSVLVRVSPTKFTGYDRIAGG